MTDVFPTVYDYTNIQIPEEVRPFSNSLLPLLEGEQEEGNPVYAASNEPLQGEWAVRDGRYKYFILNAETACSGNGEDNAQLYDLAEDPDEAENLIDTQASIASGLHEKLCTIFRGGWNCGRHPRTHH